MAQKISVIIPNYNGEKLLKKNLPQVIKNCPDAEIIVVDDASKDRSASLIKKNFKSIKLIEQKSNQGFARSVNAGVKTAKGNLVLLLNSDVTPTDGFLEKAIVHFENSDVFSVGMADRSHEQGKIVIKGKGGGKFTKGFLNHFAAKIERGESLWTSGGSSLIDREKFEELGGFDEVYAPFYWEDIDICWRARKKGYICIFEPESTVDHYHEEGAINKTYNDSFIKSVSYKNQFIFVWKNISNYEYIMEHILFLPYHFLKAATRMDTAFFRGFFLALLKIPHLIANYELSTTNLELKDKEVLSKFEKP